MDGLLVELGASSPGKSDLTRLVMRLLAEVGQLRGEVAHLRRENLELRKQVAYWKSMHARASQRLEKLQEEVEHLGGENRKLQAQLFGRKSEKHSARDRSNDLEDPQEIATQPQRRRGQQPDKPGPQRRD